MKTIDHCEQDDNCGFLCYLDHFFDVNFDSCAGVPSFSRRTATFLCIEEYSSLKSEQAHKVTQLQSIVLLSFLPPPHWLDQTHSFVCDHGATVIVVNRLGRVHLATYTNYLRVFD